jgi:hypothetical protein
LIPGRGKRFFSNSQGPDRLWGPPSHLSNALSPGVKRPGREVDRSLSFSAEVKNGVAVHPHSYKYIYIYIYISE